MAARLPVTFTGRGDDAASPLQSLVERAVNLARHLEQYQKALASISTCPPEDTRRRLTALFLLAEPVEMPRQELIDVSGISEEGLRNMQELDLIKLHGPMAYLTRFGESFLALLYMFSKEVTGGTSQGYLDLIQAVTGGGYDPTFTAQLLVGSALREAARMKAETGNENPISLAKRKVDRDLASDRVQKAVDLLERGLPPDIQAELRAAATELTHANVQQRQVAARLTRENVTLPQGKRYADLEEVLQQHSWTSFVKMLSEHPRLFAAVPRAPALGQMTDDLIHAFATKDVEVRLLETARPVEGPPPPPEAIRLMVKDLEGFHGEGLWHKVATGGRSYLCGVWFANVNKVPPELRAMGIHFEWRDAPRVKSPPFLDCPTIIVKRQP